MGEEEFKLLKERGGGGAAVREDEDEEEDDEEEDKEEEDEEEPEEREGLVEAGEGIFLDNKLMRFSLIRPGNGGI